ncbi:MAG TPA: tRNA dihydrouridine(20/20a) synthase DusA [Chromatiaceae bacterium]|nr:tRNA dihydrouridine(20/20a) synthase DusA [Chromatiaceae bacterium]
MSPHTYCIAPMLDCTDRHDRFFLRLLSSQVRLYTEMVTTGALIHGDRLRFLGFDSSEHPLALQLGGSDRHAMATCAKLAEEAGFDEVNINVGCPSDRVQSGQFGACLMAEPQRVADCVEQMTASVSIPITVKHRIGIDDLDSYEHLSDFVATIASAGCKTFIVHARKAWLKGLSPKQNREVPPLQYARVRQLTADYPELAFVVNGGIENQRDVQQHLRDFDGVMVGREAYHNPYSLADVDQTVFGSSAAIATREAVVDAYLPYIQQHMKRGVPLAHMARHMIGLYKGEPGAKQWRRAMSEHTREPGVGIEVIEKALLDVREKTIQVERAKTDYNSNCGLQL